MAYEIGSGVAKDFAQALNWYRQSAGRGLAQAMKKLGGLAEEGRGLPQNYIDAYKWFELAAKQYSDPSDANERAGALKSRDRLAARMTQGQIAEAQRLAREWTPQEDAPEKGTPKASAGGGAPQQSASRESPPAPGAARPQPSPSPPASPSSGDDDTLVSDVQTLLIGLGFDPGPVDGSLGPTTRRAIEAFQRSQSLPVDGRVTPALRYRLAEVFMARSRDGTLPGRGQVATRGKDDAAPGREERPAPSSPPSPSRGAAKSGGSGRAPADDSGGDSSGTGFYVSGEGHVLTNAHVVEGCREMQVTVPASPPVAAAVVATDETADLALLKVGGAVRAVAPFHGGPSPRIGEPVVVFGFPLAGALATSGNLVTGTLSALAGLRNNPRHYQITAPVQPGNSGGSLLGEDGGVIGVVVSKLNASRVAAVTGDIPQNVNFAVKASAAIGFLEANGVLPAYTTGAEKLSPADAGALAQKFTVMVVCRQ